MKRICADFKRQPRPSKVLWGVCALLVAIALASAAWAWDAWKKAQDAQASLRGAVAQKDAAPSPVPVVTVPRPYEQSARRILAERSIPWSQGLTTLEATAVVGVTPMSVDFGNSETAIRLEVSFVDYGALLEYVNALNAGEPELRWKLAQSQASTANSSTAVLVGTWTPR